MNITINKRLVPKAKSEPQKYWWNIDSWFRDKIYINKNGNSFYITVNTIKYFTEISSSIINI